MLEAFTEIFRLEINDGLRFDIAALEVSAIRADQKYKGVRLKTLAYLEDTRIPITIDIGFGDSIYDPAYRVCIPSLLDMPTANVRAYPPAAVIAEKFQAIVRLGLVNGRMKDYFDLWVLPDSIAIESADLDAAILSTFRRRETAIPRSVPIGL